VSPKSIPLAGTRLEAREPAEQYRMPFGLQERSAGPRSECTKVDWVYRPALRSAPPELSRGFTHIYRAGRWIRTRRRQRLNRAEYSHGRNIAPRTKLDLHRQCRASQGGNTLVVGIIWPIDRTTASDGQFLFREGRSVWSLTQITHRLGPSNGPRGIWGNGQNGQISSQSFSRS
jgi:hypothetical protein